MLTSPLQLGIPDGPELYVVLLIRLLVTAIPTLYVYYDATQRNDENRILWTVATAIGGLVGHVIGALLIVVLYLVVGRD